MKNAIEARRARVKGRGQCRKRGCNEHPTISVIIRMLEYPPKPGDHIASSTRSRVFCDAHAKEIFERLEDLLDNE